MSRQVSAWGSLVIQLGAVILALAVSLTALHSARESERARVASERARQEAGAQSLTLVCAMIIAQDEVVNDPDDPPPTDRARKAAKAWRDLRTTWC